MPSIRKRNGKYQAQIRRLGHKTLSRTFTRKKDALEWANEMELYADRYGMPNNLRVVETMTLHDMLERYIRDVIPTKRNAKNEIIILNAFIRNRFCHKPLSQITGEDFEIYKRKRLQEVLGSTINREFNIIKHAYNTAINIWEIPIAKNPLNSIKKAPTPKPRDRRLTSSEYNALLSHAKQCCNIDVYKIIVIAIETAMRRSEILNIHTQHIDYERKTLHIPDSKNGHSRTIPLSKTALSILQTNQYGLLFNLSEKALRYHWEQICKKADIKNIRLHDLRHEAISRFFERGLSIPEVALISGHRDFRQLFIYTNLKAENIVRKL